MKSVCKYSAGGILAALLALDGCGGGSSGADQIAGIGGTGKIASGTITGFGSIFVNGGEYDIDNAACEVNDEDRTGDCQPSLRIGMVVTVASDDFTDTRGSATRVLYDAEVEGPLSGLIDDGSSKHFSVLGTAVTVDSATTRFEGFSFDSIAMSDVVEVSGFFDGNGVLHATYVERRGSFVPGATQVEIKGTVASVNANSFTLNGLTVNLSAATDLGEVPGGAVTIGMFVDTRGVLTAAGEIDALRVEQEETESAEDGDQASFEGLISDFVDNSDFRVAGQAVDASSAVFEPASLALADGRRVEVEGIFVNDVLVAREVEAEGGEIEIHARVSGMPSGDSFTLALGSGPGNLTVMIDQKTEFEAETGGDLDSLAGLADGDFVEVRAFDDGAGSVVASKVRREFSDDVILQGPVDSVIPDVSITVLGVTFQLQATGADATDYEDEDDAALSASAFFNALGGAPGQLVKIRDNRSGSGGNPVGVADEVDLED